MGKYVCVYTFKMNFDQDVNNYIF